MVVSGLGGADERCTALEALPLKIDKEGARYSEQWLQELIQRFPALLPVDEVEPGLVPLVPVCMELPLTSGGFADNILMTRAGGLVLVETKLWRNPQARREVLGQVLEYAKDLAGFTYEELQRRVAQARKEPKTSLFNLVCGSEVAADEEARFIDSVSRNLRLGRFLLMIAGDGIQENAEQLAAFVQRHLGLHFTLAMVEISLWREPTTGSVFVQPKVQIERAVVRLEEGVALQPSRITPAPASAKPTTLSGESYYETLAQTDPSLPQRLQSFLAEAEQLGVFPDIRRNLSIKWRSPEGRDFQLGVVDLLGRLGTDYVHATAQPIGRVDLSHAYEARLVAAVPGASVLKTPTEVGWRAVLGKENLPVAKLLDHKDAWLGAIEDYTAALAKALVPAGG